MLLSDGVPSVVTSHANNSLHRFQVLPGTEALVFSLHAIHGHFSLLLADEQWNNASSLLHDTSSVTLAPESFPAGQYLNLMVQNRNRQNVSNTFEIQYTSQNQVQQLKSSHVYSQRLSRYQTKFYEFILQADTNYTVSLTGVNNATGDLLLYGAVSQDSQSLPSSLHPSLLADRDHMRVTLDSRFVRECCSFK